MKHESWHPGSKWYCILLHNLKNVKESPPIDTWSGCMKWRENNEHFVSDWETSAWGSCGDG